MKHLIFIALMALILASSCKKENPGPLSPIKKTLTSIEYQYSTSTTRVDYTYDDQGRLLTADDGDDRTTIQYAGDEVFIQQWRNSENREVFNFKGTLNPDGDLMGGTSTSKYVAHLTFEQTHEYEYDANGYLIRASMNRNNGERYEYQYKYLNGNMIEQKSYTNSVFDYQYNYEYATSGYDEHSSILNVSAFLPENTVTGKTSAQKPIKYTGIRPGVVDISTTNTYTTDADGYVVQQESVQTNGNKFTIIYHYE